MINLCFVILFIYLYSKKPPFGVVFYLVLLFSFLSQVIHFGLMLISDSEASIISSNENQKLKSSIIRHSLTRARVSLVEFAAAIERKVG